MSARLNAPRRGADSSPLELGDTVEVRAVDESLGTALASERNAVLRHAVERLSERERQVLSFVHVQELPGAEIGRILGLTESRISQILTGIRGKLRVQLVAYEGDCQAA